MDSPTAALSTNTLIARVRSACVEEDDARAIQAIGDAVHSHIYRSRIGGLEEQAQAVALTLGILVGASHANG